MNTISISVTGTDLETINITLSDAEVKAIYESNKEYKTKVESLDKELKSCINMKEYYSKLHTEVTTEVSSMHALLTALDVPEKYKNEGMYSEVQYPLSTRMALFLAKKG
jgi:hypothetical protein